MPKSRKCWPGWAVALLLSCALAMSYAIHMGIHEIDVSDRGAAIFWFFGAAWEAALMGVTEITVRRGKGSQL